MKLHHLLTLLSLSLLVASCTTENWDNEPDNRFTEYEPVLINRDLINKNIELKSPRNLSQTGKIYAYGDFIFISEIYEGIHIINNVDHSNPANIGFVEIPGCVDMAVRNDVLYADNATDLLAININDPFAPEFAGRTEDVFPYPTPPDSRAIPEKFKPHNLPEGTVILKWIKK